MTLQLLTTRAQSEGILERWDDAIRDDLRVHDLAVRKQGPKSFFAVATLGAYLGPAVQPRALRELHQSDMCADGL